MALRTLSSEDLLSRHSDAWIRATRHPFLEGVRQGDLPVEAFYQWLVQDYKFVQDGLYSAHARLAAASPYEDRRLHVSGLSAEIEEMDWFQRKAAERGVDLAQPYHPVCRRYVDFLAALAFRAYPVGLVSIWALERAYLEAWRSAGPTRGPYQEFVDRWTNPGFGRYVESLGEAVDRALARSSTDEWTQADEIFLVTCELEEAFWTMAYGK